MDILLRVLKQPDQRVRRCGWGQHRCMGDEQLTVNDLSGCYVTALAGGDFYYLS